MRENQSYAILFVFVPAAQKDKKIYKNMLREGIIFPFLFSYLTTTTDDECQHIFKFIAVENFLFSFFLFLVLLHFYQQISNRHHTPSSHPQILSPYLISAVSFPSWFNIMWYYTNQEVTVSKFTPLPLKVEQTLFPTKDTISLYAYLSFPIFLPFIFLQKKKERKKECTLKSSSSNAIHFTSNFFSPTLSQLTSRFTRTWLV